MKINWVLKKFDELSLQELYDCMALRQWVFVVEQDCPYLDCDGKDQFSHHLMGYTQHKKLVAYSRLVAPDISYMEASIGRVVTAKSIRKQGVGIALMQQSINKIYEIYGETPIRISAQKYLDKFYQSFGFVPTGKEYLEDGIPHIEMLLP